MGFIVFLAQDFKKFIKSLETSEPMIHLLHPKCMQLLRSIFSKFLKPEVFMNTNNGEISLKSGNDLVDLDVNDNHKAVCDFGTHAEKLMQKHDELEKKRVKSCMKDALVSCCSYLLTKLPRTEQVVNDVQYISHQSQYRSKKAICAIKSLTNSTVNCLDIDVLRKEFKVKDVTKDDLVDSIIEEFKLYQLENIPSSFTEVISDQKKKRRQRYSYWKYAYGLIDVETQETSDTSSYVRIDQYTGRRFQN